MAIADVAPIVAALLGLGACTYPPLPARPCDPMSSYGPPQVLPWSQLPAGDVGPVRLSDDERTIYFDDTQDLFVASRSDRSAAFGPPARLDAVNAASARDIDPMVSHDGSTLWFASERSGPDLLYVARHTAGGGFGSPAPLTAINDPTQGVDTWQPFVSADGSELWFSSDRAAPTSGEGGGFDLWRAHGSSADFAAPEFVAEVSSPDHEWLPMLSPDGLTLFFSRSDQPGNDGVLAIWRAHRDARDQPFHPPGRVTELAGASRAFATWMSPDACRLYGSRTNNAGTLYGFVATQQP